MLIDTRVSLRSPLELTGLVSAIVAASPNDETDWLEWKSGMDLGQKDSHVTIAWHILGMANRRVADALRQVGRLRLHGDRRQSWSENLVPFTGAGRPGWLAVSGRVAHVPEVPGEVADRAAADRIQAGDVQVQAIDRQQGSGTHRPGCRSGRPARRLCRCGRVILAGTGFGWQQDRPASTISPACLPVAFSRATRAR